MMFTHTDDSRKWDLRMLAMAEHISHWSKDESTRVGAVISDDNRIVSLGYNGFPRGVKDEAERIRDRELKYLLTVHAEINAILFAKRDIWGCTIYTFPFQPCSQCAAAIIQSGIMRVVTYYPTDELRQRWGRQMEIAAKMFAEANVALTLYERGLT